MARIPARVAVAALALAALAAAAAQQPPPSPGPAPTARLNEQVTASGNPIAVEALGLTLQPPKNAVFTTRDDAGRIITAIALPDSLGTIVVQRRRPARDDLNQIDMERSIAAALLGADPGGTPPTETERGRLLTPFPQINAAGRATRIVYADLAPEPSSTDRALRGFAIIPDGHEGFLVFELFTTAGAANQARRIFEHFLETAAPIDPARDDRRVDRAIRAGVEALLALTPEEYQRAIERHGERFERLYRPGAGPRGEDEEIGYQRAHARTGFRGELEGKDPSRWRGVDHARGYLLTIETRLLLDDRAAATARTRIFLADDRRRESWNTEIAFEHPGRREPAVFTEIASRDFDRMTILIDPGRTDPRLVARAFGAGSETGREPPPAPAAVARASRTIRPDVRLEGYLSRFEVELLPWLLGPDAIDAPAAFPSYDRAAEAVRLLAVRAEPEDDRPRLVALTAAGRATVTTYDTDGRPERIELPGGVVREPIDPVELRRLYVRRGLPLD